MLQGLKTVGPRFARVKLPTASCNITKDARHWDDTKIGVSIETQVVVGCRFMAMSSLQFVFAYGHRPVQERYLTENLWSR
jgi:hypothetical protein